MYIIYYDKVATPDCSIRELSTIRQAQQNTFFSFFILQLYGFEGGKKWEAVPFSFFFSSCRFLKEKICSQLNAAVRKRMEWFAWKTPREIYNRCISRWIRSKLYASHTRVLPNECGFFCKKQLKNSYTKIFFL